jgi:hypothetical protein
MPRPGFTRQRKRRVPGRIIVRGGYCGRRRRRTSQQTPYPTARTGNPAPATGPGTPRGTVRDVFWTVMVLRLDAELKVTVLPLDDELPELPDGRVAK